MSKTVFFELEISNPDEQLLLYAVGEELLLKNNRVVWYSRISNTIIRIEFKSSDDKWKDLAVLTNCLRTSKNVAAHICAITMVE